MNIEELKNIKEDYIRELVKFYREKGISKESIEMLDYMIHSAKNLCKIIEACEEEEMGYSGARGGYSNRSYAGGNSYGGNSYGGSYAQGGGYSNESYARGRGSNASRDSMGRYSSAGGYSGHHEVIEGLHELMGRTQDENTRREIQDMINRFQ